jgi:hypothetical protein
MQLTVPFCKRLVNTFCVTSSDYQVDLGSDDNCSIPFGEHDGIQLETLEMCPSQAIGGSEIDLSHDIKKPLGFVAFYLAPGLEISCYAGRSLV